VLSTGRGALWPRPQRLASLTTGQSRSSWARSSSPAWRDSSLRSSISSCTVPERQGMHLPHDSSRLKAMKKAAMSTMLVVSSSTTIPPEPMIVPRVCRLSSFTGVSRAEAGTQPPEGPPVCTALMRRPAGAPPPMVSTIVRNGVPIGTSSTPLRRT
jgi:hypothetical protein